ncbi:hypothetical protein Dimus_012841 [Dionaea muscipula]
MEHLVDHMRTSFHSIHEPACGICGKHCRSFESLREHLIGPLPKVECARIFSTRGCILCLTILDSPNSQRVHRRACQQPNATNGLVYCMGNLGIHDELRIDNTRGKGPQVIALSCKMVGGGSDGSMDLCARICLVDEQENIVFYAYVKPHVPVTNYRFETTGMRPEYLRDAMPLRQVQRKIQDFMCNGEPVWKIRSRGGRARILVGHGLDHELECMGMEYPTVMIRYDIHTGGIQDPYEDCVATMRLYMRMRSQNHKTESYPLANDPQNRNNFASWRESELQNMTPEELLDISRSDFYCWCLDFKGYA